MSEKIEIQPYDDEWPEMFKAEATYLMQLLPQDILLEFHHIGSTAIPEMPAKPTIDIGVMVTTFTEAKAKIVKMMEAEGYTYQWRDDVKNPFMTFSKIDENGITTHHIHMAEEEHDFWDCLYFREYLKKHRDEARNYFDLKIALAKQFPDDKKSYNAGKAEYVQRVTAKAKKEIDEF